MTLNHWMIILPDRILFCPVHQDYAVIARWLDEQKMPLFLGTFEDAKAVLAGMNAAKVEPIGDNLFEMS